MTHDHRHTDDSGHEEAHQPAGEEPWEATAVTCPERRPGIATVTVDDEIVVTHPEAFGVIHLDPVTTILWRSFGPGVSVGELATDVADAIGIPTEEALDKLRGVVTTLGRTGFLVEPAEPPMRRIPRFPTIPPDT